MTDPTDELVGVAASNDRYGKPDPYAVRYHHPPADGGARARCGAHVVLVPVTRARAAGCTACVTCYAGVPADDVVRDGPSLDPFHSLWPVLRCWDAGASPARNPGDPRT